MLQNEKRKKQCRTREKWYIPAELPWKLPTVLTIVWGWKLQIVAEKNIHSINGHSPGTTRTRRRWMNHDDNNEDEDSLRQQRWHVFQDLTYDLRANFVRRSSSEGSSAFSSPVAICSPHDGQGPGWSWNHIPTGGSFKSVTNHVWMNQIIPPCAADATPRNISRWIKLYCVCGSVRFSVFWSGGSRAGWLSRARSAICDNGVAGWTKLDQLQYRMAPLDMAPTNHEGCDQHFQGSSRCRVSGAWYAKNKTCPSTR